MCKAVASFIKFGDLPVDPINSAVTQILRNILIKRSSGLTTPGNHRENIKAVRNKYNKSWSTFILIASRKISSFLVPF